MSGGTQRPWETRWLGEVSAIKTGKKNNEDKTEGGQYPFFVRSQTVERINSYSFDGEAILVPGEGGIGTIFHYINGRFDYHQRVYKISNFADDVCGKFIYYYMVENFNKQATRNSVKATVDSLRLPTFLSFEFLSPPLPEQRAIAAALADVDELLAGLDRQIAKHRAVKTAAMQQLLSGRVRLPGFGGAWEQLNMARNSVLKARIGWQGLTTAEYKASGQYYLVTGTDFANGRVQWSGAWFVDESRYRQDRNIQLQIGDVLLTKDGTIGKVGYVETLPGPATLNSGVFVIRPKAEAYDPLFFFYILTSEVFNDFLIKLQAGSTISHLYQKDFVNFSFMAPSKEEQRAIAAVLSDMDAAIAALEAQRAKTAQLKQGMMQQLLSGRVRLI